MIMTEQALCDVTSKHQNSNKSETKSIDKICAKLQLNADLGQQLSDIVDITSDEQQSGHKRDLTAPIENGSIASSIVSDADASLSIEDVEVLNSDMASYDRPSVINGSSNGKEFDSMSAEKMDTEKVDQKSNKLKPRHTTQYNNWHYTDMIMAIKAVQSKRLSMTAAAKKHGIPRTTLRHYLNDGTNKEAKRASFSLPKEYEDDLVQYILDCQGTEKHLYKKICDKAKEFSQIVASDKGEDERRVAPTPAWIRRFVYRHKQLYELFPTFLTKWEHPLHGGRKTPNELEELNFHEQNDGGNTKKEKHCTSEIIFPKTNYDPYGLHHNEQATSKLNEDFVHISRIRYDEQDFREMKARETFHPYSMVGDELNYNFESRHWAKIEHDKITADNFESDDERMLPYKDLLSRISKSSSSSQATSPDTRILHFSEQHFQNGINSSPFLRYDLESYENSCKDVSHTSPVPTTSNQFISLSSVPLLYPDKRPSTTSVISTIHNDMSRNNTPNSDLHYSTVNTSYSDKLRSIAKPLQNGIDLTNDIAFSEIGVMKRTLEVMEKSLGNDYVQLFSERYRRNRRLERLYSKWVLLKSDIDSTDDKAI